MTKDDIFDAAWNELQERIDGSTLRAGLSLEETAQLYRELAAECRERAVGLEAEANEGDA